VIRVGFALEHDSGWLGGINYFRNLLFAIQSLPDTKIRPVVFVGMKSDVEAFEGMAEIVRSPLLDRKSAPWLLRRFLERVFPRRDYLLYWLLKKHRIDVLSHQGELWRGCSIRSIGWIPDFQHVHLPGFYSAYEVAARNRAFSRLLGRSDAILLSSEDALNDLRRFSPENQTPTYVLRFNSCLINQMPEALNKEDVEKRYGLDRPWFHLPNQFWKHKNHKVVIKALHLLKQQDIDPLVVATGSTNDYRNPGYFSDLQKQIGEYGVAKSFLILGMLPYSEVVSLMRYSVAVINPSLFEGWSTTVEEAKAMGKKVLLSDIPVHREQSPDRGVYFRPDQAHELAEQMKQCLEKFDAKLEERVTLEHLQNTEIRKKEFAQNYEQILLRVYHPSDSSST
jgi:glycosyltransferase involved in cell wall biosynthesis